MNMMTKIELTLVLLGAAGIIGTVAVDTVMDYTRHAGKYFFASFMLIVLAVFLKGGELLYQIWSL